ncbi:MAG: protein kinase [Lachnospiraceae bacterium]|nr:protein kinase [Lachnospiraceae bacterium]
MQELKQRGYVDVVPVGRGSYGKVYRIRKEGGPAFWACKILEDRRLWERESTFLRRAGHPLFPTYRECWWQGERGFLVMDYVSGQDLAGLLDRRGGFCRRQVLRIATALAEGMAWLQEQDPPILFRDLKPSNIRICEDGGVRLLDLGCACPAEGDGSLGGTPGYAPPEQLKMQGQIGTYSDVYAFGKVLLRLMGGDRWCRMNRLAADCVRENPLERLPDMGCVLNRLKRMQTADLSGKPEGMAGQRRGRCFYEKDICKH